jgi:tetratricopeptide (TPR) repeat protein
MDESQRMNQMLEEGMNALRTGDLETARSLLAQAVASSPLDAAAYEALAEVLSAQGRLEVARDLCDTALAQLPAARYLHRKAVELSIGLDDMAGALRAAERFVLAFEDDVDAWVLLGDLRLKSGKLDAALRAFQHARACDEDDWMPWHRIGLLYEQRADLRASTVALENSVRLAPENYRPFRSLARVLKALGKDAEVGTAFATARRLARHEAETPTH